MLQTQALFGLFRPQCVAHRFHEPVHERRPLRCRILAVKQENFADPAQFLFGQATQRRGQLHRVGVLAIHHKDAVFALFQHFFEVAHRLISRVTNQREVFKAVFMPLVQQGQKLFITVQYIAFVSFRRAYGVPVQPALVGVTVSVCIVPHPGFPDPAWLCSIGHQEERLDIRPSDPFREQALNSSDAVADLLIDFY